MAQTIRQAALKSILTQRAAIEKAEARLKAAEAAVFDSLKAGATVAAGLFTAEIRQYSRTNVAWKVCFVEQIDKRDGEGAGNALATRISASTPATNYESLTVKVNG